MPFRPRRLLLPLVVLAAAGGAGLWWRNHQKAEPVTFTTVTVSHGTLTQSVTATGELQPVETVEVSSQISGLLTEVPVDYNSQVKAGDVLARIDPATYQSRLRQAEADLANTTANHRLMSLNAERTQALYDRKLVSQQELDQAIAQLAQAQAQLLIRTAAVETAKVDLGRCTITAPIDGIILDRPAIAGKTVSASTSAPVLFILVNDLRRLQIKAAIAEADIGNVKEGQEVSFTVDAFPSQSFRGVVRQIRNQPVVSSNVVTYATLIDVQNENLALKPGMTANVSVTIQERPDALLVPNAALRARIPDEFKLPPDPKPAPVAATTGNGTPTEGAAGAATPEESLRKLLAEVGYVASEGSRPSREQMTRVRALATERGITLPERRGRRGGSGAPAGETVRTLYLAAGSPDKPMAKPVEVRLGITDGLNTEVLSGLDEKAVLVSGVADQTTTAPTAARNPFSGGGGGRRF